MATTVAIQSRTVLPKAAPYLIEQDYSAYTTEQHAIWAELVRRRMPQLERHAAQEYLDGFESLCLPYDRLPNLAAVSAKLNDAPAGMPLRSAASCPRLPSLRCLRRGVFPPPLGCAAATRSNTRLSPTSFTMSLATCPMHAHPVFADFLAHYGQLCARIAGRGHS